MKTPKNKTKGKKIRAWLYTVSIEGEKFLDFKMSEEDRKFCIDKIRIVEIKFLD